MKSAQLRLCLLFLFLLASHSDNTQRCELYSSDTLDTSIIKNPPTRQIIGTTIPITRALVVLEFFWLCCVVKIAVEEEGSADVVAS